jgi:phage-related protein (TIGR01555 family)
MSKTKPHRARAIDKAAAAIRQGTTDSFVNMGARLGYGAGSQQDGAHYQLNYISRNPFQLEAAYRTNWLCGMVVDMTRAGAEFLSDDIDPDDQKAMHKELERLNIWGGLCDALKWGRLYGGGVLVMLIDGQNMSTPLNLDTVGKDQFKGVVALDRWQVNPSLHDLVTDFGPDLGKPKYYDVTPSARALIGERIHHSRVVRIDGLDLPWRQQLAENGWGQSVLERLWDRVVAFDSTTEGAAQLIYKAHLRTVKIPGFREIVAMGGPAFDGVVKQLDFMRRTQSNEGLTVLDGADEFETHQYSFSGLADMMLQFGQQLSGATQIPLVRLFGQSPAGMNSTGESDLRTYYDGIAQQQDQRLRPGVGKILELVHRSKFGKPLDEGFEFDFVPLWQMTAEQKATVAKTITEAITSAEESGLISPAIAARELRQASRATGVFSHIDDDYIDQLDTEPPAPDDVAVDPVTGEPIAPAPEAIGEKPVKLAAIK